MGNLYNYLVAFSAAMGGLLFGYEIGVIGQVLTMDSFGLLFKIKYINGSGSVVTTPDTDNWTGWITFMFLIGCVFGAISVSYLADFLGRKRSIILGSLTFLVGVTVQVVASTIAVLYTGRFISGFAIGLLSMVVPLFISETAPTEIRGRMIAVQQLMITIGILLAAIINSIIIKVGTATGNFEWRLGLALQGIPGIVLFLLTFFIPYSPRWLANNGRDDEAIAVLAKLRSEPVDSAAIRTEYDDIKASIEMERQVGTADWSELVKPGMLNRVVLVVLLQFFQQWTGINVILYYQDRLVASMGFDPSAAQIPFNIAINTFNMLGTFPGMYLIERLGRRKLLIVGGLGMATALYITCFSLVLSQAHGKGFAWVAICGVFLFELSFASTWGPVVWVYQSEMFPLRVRSKGTGCGTISNWSNGAIISKVSPFISTSMGFYQYLVYGTFGFLMAAFTYLVVPETMGKSLEAMDNLFGADNSMFRHRGEGKAASYDVEFAITENQ
ncbi:general substrate transporter [Blyttiomyces helicus]|uniref:General substrate transporter n=1 Tax=Blyttiomyces helicus TaxID=388810 RepID=A0A4V1IPM5_9FUNG|nr:general substrate transporter [Blyttiomyces helicus]|eukprot:RKO83577.1 general substrate transporter [Blyttiomyces helicus]